MFLNKCVVYCVILLHAPSSEIEIRLFSARENGIKRDGLHESAGTAPCYEKLVENYISYHLQYSMYNWKASGVV